MDISGTMPEPPATSSSGRGSDDGQVNQPPIGPRSSTWSPGSATAVRYGETSPSSSRWTVICTVPPVVDEPALGETAAWPVSGALAME
jgi:hypothetical protein